MHYRLLLSFNCQGFYRTYRIIFTFFLLHFFILFPWQLVCSVNNVSLNQNAGACVNARSPLRKRMSKWKRMIFVDVLNTKRSPKRKRVMSLRKTETRIVL